MLWGGWLIIASGPTCESRSRRAQPADSYDDDVDGDLHELLSKPHGMLPLDVLLTLGHAGMQFLHNALPRSPFRARPFSSTPSIQSSLFRQTDKTQSSRPPSPAEEYTEHPHESQPPEDVDSGVYYSPYQPKRSWPPDMSKLSKKHQFRLERKYRRRAALKYARPRWTKATKLVQWGIIGWQDGIVLIYAVLFMDWDPKDNPVEEVRKEFFSGVNSIFSSPQPPSPAHRGEDKEK
ncbi:hypothetical protein NFIA_104920 [Paecilomyces variotii No. 5]|uniref:Uncharacterized protein n=1 Tax=Byssochlamys spectabilis (strain No. 5 / NBRC 109023) TaxID=1356009 RepID=V5G0S6_BYSSN|nr:hypothetical protein NFIA_104920 [Paecilomyces variotii No. 5]